MRNWVSQAILNSMFVRKKPNKSGSVSIQIIEKVKRKNKIIKTIGRSTNKSEIDRLYRKALKELPKFYGASLFDINDEPAISELSNDSIRVIGPEKFLNLSTIKLGSIK